MDGPPQWELTLNTSPERGDSIARGGRLSRALVRQTFTAKYRVKYRPSTTVRYVATDSSELTNFAVKVNPASLSPLALLTFSWLHRRHIGSERA